MKKFASGILSAIFCLYSFSVCSQNIWTQHNDQSRTGWYPYESTLNTGNVNKNSFGLNFNHVLDDQIYVQPLVVMNVNIPAKGIKNVVYVATVNNTIYAFDADVNAPAYWVQNYTGSIAPAGTSCGNCRPAANSDIHPSLCSFSYGDFSGNMGIVGTPVIDTVSKTMYFVTKIVNNNEAVDNHGFQAVNFEEYTWTETGFHEYLHAIDITTGIEKPNSPVEITATMSGTGDGSVSNTIKYTPRRQFNRAGLALNNGILYIAFAAHCDNNPSHGWIMSFDASSLSFLHSFMTTPNDGRGGVWMSGVAPAIDAAGNIYFTTGNSLNESGTSTVYHKFNSPESNALNRGESVVKLNPDLTLSSYFTPFDYKALNDADLDFGTQMMILPNTGSPGLVMTGCKDDSLYVFDMSNLGGFSTVINNTKQRVFVANGATMHSTFAYFGGPTPLAYQFSENSLLKSYPVSVNGLGAATTNTNLSTGGGNGGFMSVSSKGQDITTGILWINQAEAGCNPNGNSCPGVLRALIANDVTKELWNSDMVTGDKISFFNKYSCPTIALGKVYLAANSNQLCIYAPKINSSCVTNQALSKPATALTNNTAAINVTDGSLTTGWTSTAVAPGDIDSIYIDLGGSMDICKIIINWTATGFGKDFDMKVSGDGINWTVVSSFRGNTLATVEFDGAVTGRYVSMVGIHKGANPYSINEFQVFGNPAASCTIPTNLNASPVNGASTSIFTTQTPAGTLVNDGIGIELGVKFTSSVSGFITGISFYKQVGNNGAHVGELYSYPGGVRLGAANFAETASGWQSVSFTAPVAITANTTYIASYFSPNGTYSQDANFFGAAITNGVLTALADGTNGVNGVFAGTTSVPTFPTTGFNKSNYWVDVMFSTSLTPPSTISEHISWNAVAAGSPYYISYRPNLSQSWITRTSSTNGLDLGALSCGTIYFYTIQATCGNSRSVVSTQGSFQTPDCAVNSCDILPTRYFNVDLGDVGVAGSTCLHGTAYTLNGSGNISNNSDQFQFAYTNKDNGDYDMTGRIILPITQTNASSKVGIMIRDSLTNTSRFAYVAYMGNKFVFEYRDVSGNPTTIVTAAGTYSLPYFAKISKLATGYTASISPDGVNWTNIGSAVDLHFGTNIANGPKYGMAVTSTDNTALSTGTVDNFNIVTSTPLPVLLLYFNAKNVNQDHVVLSWATSMEHLTNQFEIQRSVDNNSFEVIDTVKAAGESEMPKYYSANDNEPVAGMNYYRLKETDQDGKFYFSPVVSINFESKGEFEMYPNPAEGYTNINSLRGTILEVSIYDVAGKLYQDIPITGGQSSVRLNTSGFPKGVYIVRVKTSKGVYLQKLSKR